MFLKRGEILKNRYRIVNHLGKGGFGAVYRAEDISLGTICALKENLDYWDEAQRQFEREARILANLRHPNLPRVTDYFVIPAQAQYLAMDFIDGYDLQTVLERVKQPLTEKRVLEWIDQICDALAYLHGQNPPIVHRDVKPANIRITPTGKAVLVDFGIAKAYDPGVRTTLGARAVTSGYSPIEQYGHGTTDTRADIYSLGATLYALLTGRQPPESVARITGETLVMPRDLNPTISAHTEIAILRAMEIVAANRFQTAIELRRALKKPASQILYPQTGPPSVPLSSNIQRLPTQPVTAATLPSRPISVSQEHTSPSRLPHPQPSNQTVASMEWITIPAGEFLYGAEKDRVQLPAFQIARFPVTKQQYKLFLEANPQHPSPAHWKGLNFPVGKAKHPVVGVSLYDAVAFCEWLGCRLPSEEEWEKAARGEDGRTYPWGGEWEEGKYCNNWDARMKGTTPVDRYAAGVSPYGVWDMAGNVWEWTTSEYQGPFMHVIRGGSWKSYSSFALRIVQRDGLVLDDMRDDLGFRCVRVP